MEQKKNPVAGYYYSEEEWARLGCGPLPAERNKEQERRDAFQKEIARNNPKIDGNVVKGYN
jgi:hypothetical protein